MCLILFPTQFEPEFPSALSSIAMHHSEILRYTDPRLGAWNDQLAAQHTRIHVAKQIRKVIVS